MIVKTGPLKVGSEFLQNPVIANENKWSERRDLNPRPPVPQAGFLPYLSMVFLYYWPFFANEIMRASKLQLEVIFGNLVSCKGE